MEVERSALLGYYEKNYDGPQTNHTDMRGRIMEKYILGDMFL